MHELLPLFAEKSTDISHMYRRSPNKVQSFKSDRGKENMYGRCQQIPGIPFQMQQQQLPTSSSFTSQAHYVTTTSNNPMPERLPFSFGDRNESSRICDEHFYNARRSNYDKGCPFCKSSRHGFDRSMEDAPGRLNGYIYPLQDYSVRTSRLHGMLLVPDPERNSSNAPESLYWE